MKIRLGFVTNSSSSSFILSKDSICIEPMTVDAVFKEIKELFEEYYNKYTPILSIVYDQIGKDFYDTYRKQYANKDIRGGASGKFKMDYGVDLFELHSFSIDRKNYMKWRHCNTYAEYERAKGKELNHQYPFEIIDYHTCENIADTWSLVDTIYWYEEKDEDVSDTEFISRDAGDDNLRGRLLKLGDIGIHSECGYIPDYVVDKLRELSVHSCNHMG